MVDSVMSTGLQGVQHGLDTARQGAQGIVSATTNTSASSDPALTQAPEPGVSTDLVEAVVSLKLGEQQVEASAAVIKTADEILGTLINIKA